MTPTVYIGFSFFYFDFGAGLFEISFVLQNEKKNQEEELKKEQKLKRLGHVEKYRKYRIGDFPDIQINYCEIIAPLQALAQRDSHMAMMLFESLFV